jgi:hypothetical protein
MLALCESWLHIINAMTQNNETGASIPDIENPEQYLYIDGIDDFLDEVHEKATHNFRASIKKLAWLALNNIASNAVLFGPFTQPSEE